MAVLGATGYAGIELIRILVQHPRVRLSVVTSQQFVGKKLSDVYPSLADRCDLILEEMRVEPIAPRADLVFAALPHETSMGVISELFERGKRIIDLSADFRLHDAETYLRWYSKHKAPHLLRKAVYGLTELHRREIARAKLVANPGCYPTGAVLGLAPLIAKKIVQGTVIIDAKSGATGAGRTSAVELSFSEVNENFKAYNVGVHRHTPEIDQELSHIWNNAPRVLFAPHLVPMSRGILCTMYVQLKSVWDEHKITELYREYYRRAPFIRVVPAGYFPQTKDVRGSNDCAIGLRYESSVKRLVVITAIDNLVKGAAGQAVQNMNVMCGWSEAEGLKGVALVP